MPNVLLPVPHFEQTSDGRCLPACVQMVLAYWNHSISERDVALLLGTKAFGTAFENVEKVRKLGYSVHFAALSSGQLRAELQRNHPVICRLWTIMLSYWEIETSHVVVAIGFDDDFVYINDPAYPPARRAVLWNEFLAAWAEFDETAAVIYPNR